MTRGNTNTITLGKGPRFISEHFYSMIGYKPGKFKTEIKGPWSTNVL